MPFVMCVWRGVNFDFLRPATRRRRLATSDVYMCAAALRALPCVLRGLAAPARRSVQPAIVDTLVYAVGSLQGYAHSHRLTLALALRDALQSLAGESPPPCARASSAMICSVCTHVYRAAL